jgi:hypothetical protein
MVEDNFMENKDSSTIDFVGLETQCLTLRNEGNLLFGAVRFVT